jgi:nucleotide-binding universal stress UspA family protein
MKRILFPTDFSANASFAFEACIKLADKTKASIQVLHVVSPEYEAADIPILSAGHIKTKVEIARELILAFVEEGVSKVYEQLENPPNIISDVEVGHPSTIITSVSMRDHTDLIVMGTKGEHNRLEELVGSVTAGVISRSEISILVIPGEFRQKFSLKTIGYATNLKESDPYRIWKTCQLLKPFSAIMRIVHIGGDQSNTEISMQDLENFFVDHAPVLQIIFHDIGKKNVVEGLNEFIDTYDIDLMAMFSPHRNIIERLFHASESKKMALHTHIPVLILK